MLTALQISNSTAVNIQVSVGRHASTIYVRRTACHDLRHGLLRFYGVQPEDRGHLSRTSQRTLISDRHIVTVQRTALLCTSLSEEGQISQRPSVGFCNDFVTIIKDIEFLIIPHVVRRRCWGLQGQSEEN